MSASYRTSMIIHTADLNRSSTRPNMDCFSSVDLSSSYLFSDEDLGDQQKTLARIMVEKFFVKWSWYNPYAKIRDSEDLDIPPIVRDCDDDVLDETPAAPPHPSIKKAWAFFEHVTLPRRTASGKRALRGTDEEGTALYSLWSTTEHEMYSWGVGVVLYFNTLKYMSILFLFVGLIHIYPMIYFASNEYAPVSKSLSTNIYRYVGSAICTEHEWVPCLNDTACPRDQWDTDSERWANYTGQIYAQRNTCGGVTLANGWINISSFFLFVLFFAWLDKQQKWKEIKSDEAKISSSDFAVVVKNPPPDAFDPEKWRNFFAQFEFNNLKPPMVTVTLNNEKLLKALMILRRFRVRLAYMLPLGIDMMETSTVKTEVEKKMVERTQNATFLSHLSCILSTCFLKPFNQVLNEAELFSKITEFEDKVRSLQREEYRVNEVYVVMETEEGQRNALKELDVGIIQTLTKSTEKSHITFDGTVLRVKNAREPSSIRWQDLSSSFIEKQVRSLITFVIVLLCFIGQALAIASVRRKNGPMWAAVLIDRKSVV